jgi:hypothetical protein
MPSYTNRRPSRQVHLKNGFRQRVSCGEVFARKRRKERIGLKSTEQAPS